MTQLKIPSHVKILLLAFLAITLFACSAQTATVPSKDIYTDAVSQPNDLWQRLRNGFALEPLHNKHIKRNEISYTKNPKFLYRITKRSERYLFYIVEEVESRGMPSEMALVPLVESAFNPIAKSSSNAVGLWQFIPDTGKSFGLKQDGWLDERQDVIAATHAALDYLQALNNKFDDWNLALAAYNWGQGAVSRSQAK
ncbi:MAG: transglycosylase SLT domain-containing protein, partial [Nitrosomonas sp.]|nr:transglycosylase SLT domain-containing protein [Nitrosomonas sp.]